MIELIIVAFCAFIDQFTKKKAVENSVEWDGKTILGKNVKLGLVYNKGAFLGILKNHKRLLMLANIGSMVILGVIAIGLFFTKGQQVAKIGVALMAGGAIGNLYDRIVRKKVVDFFAFKWKSNIYFNLADLFVFLGGFLIAVGGVIEGFKK